MSEVRTRYEWYGSFERDEAATAAAGRPADNSGCGLGDRDLGWNCACELDAHRIKRALERHGFKATVHP